MSVDTLFFIGSFVCFLGTVNLIIAVIKNRKILYGYSLLGALLTFVAVVIFQICFYMMKNY